MSKYTLKHSPDMRTEPKVLTQDVLVLNFILQA